jgi:polyisoprenoid-binding protein YceI
MRLTTTLALLLLVSSAAAAEPSIWKIDPSHSSVQFAVRHLMVSTVRGHFGTISGVARIDENDLTKSSVEATIDATSIDTRDEKRDAHLKDTDFLDVAKYPTITFKSKSVRKLDDTHFEVVGDLTLRDVTRPVVLRAEGSPVPITDPHGTVKLGGVARARIDRQDFGVSFGKMMDSGGLVVGDDVEITIDVELNRR